MPVNSGQGQTTRWYQLCFVPTSPDSSDDSDIESVVLTPIIPTPTSTTPTPTGNTWQALSPPLSPSPSLLPSREPQIDSPFLPPQLPPPSPNHVFEGDQSDCSMSAMNDISRERVSGIDNKLFHCPICMDEFRVCDQAFRLPCNHTYCSECILRWLNNNKTCPVCRLQLNSCSFESINDTNSSDLPLEIPLPPSPLPLPLNHNDLPRRWEQFFESPPYLIPSVENNINDNNGLDSQFEILSLPSLSRSVSLPVGVDSSSQWEYLYEPPPHLIPGIENSAGGNSDEADYDSACDEPGDSHEDGASHSTPDPLI